MGKFVLPVARDESGKVKLEAFGDALAEEMLARLVKVTVKKTSADVGRPDPGGAEGEGPVHDPGGELLVAALERDRGDGRGCQAERAGEGAAGDLAGAARTLVGAGDG